MKAALAQTRMLPVAVSHTGYDQAGGILPTSEAPSVYSHGTPQTATLGDGYRQPLPTHDAKPFKPMNKKDIGTVALLLLVSLVLSFLWFGFHFEIDQAPTPRVAQLPSSP